MSDYLKFISPTDLVLPAVHYSLVFGATNAASQKNIFGYSCHIALKDIQGLGMANTSRQFRGDVAFSDDVIANAEPLPLYVNKSTIKHGDDPHMSSVTRDFKLSLGRKFQPSPNLRNWQAKAKRFCDIAFSASALAGLSPLLAIISLAIVLESRGSVFFLQEREGKDGELFTAIKFRSMRRDDADISGIKQTTHGDVRVTKVGRFIRRTSIDELPQLLNVLRGDMSLVGPRPHVKGMLAGGRDYRALVPYYELRLHVMPGLTGLAQANGLRGPTADADLALRRIEYDLDYIENFSIFLDIKIILQTLKREFLGGSGH